MSDSDNPPLETGAPGAGDDTGDSVGEHTSGPIVNPPLDQVEGDRPAGVSHDNPALDAAGAAAAGSSGDDNPSLGMQAIGGGHGENPPLDEAELEAWFAAQLSESATTVPTAKSVSASSTTARSSRTRTAKKSSAKKSTARRRTAKRSTAKKSTAPRRTAKKSTGGRGRRGSTAKGS